MPTATTVRLPPELHARLAAYCDRTGAVRNRVLAIALAEYLGDDEQQRPPALPVQPPEEGEQGRAA
jgi:predicted transcriptional regulator